MMLPHELRPFLGKLGGYDRPTIHIAGSKGKGSTCMLLAHLLKLKGKKVGQFISPYLLDERECLQINGELISETEFERLRSLVPQELSPFEQRTLMALRYFQEQNCDYVVLETGWGGEKDATNIVESKILTILTHIELEHTHTLGADLKTITEAKLGITREGVPLLTALSQVNEVHAAIQDRGLTPIFCPSVELGYHHPESVGLAWEAMKQLGFTLTKNELTSLKELSLPGRFEIIKYGPHTLIMDGAHTQDSVSYVQELVQKYQKEMRIDKVTWAIHFLSDKPDTLSQRFSAKNTFWVPIDDERAGNNPSQFEEISPTHLLEKLSSTKIVELLVIVGSFKLVAALKSQLK